MASPPVLVIGTDDRWLRVLEVTLRLGGFTPVVRRSLADAERLRGDDDRLHAVIFDLEADSAVEEARAARRLHEELQIPVIIVLPETLADEQEMFTDAGLRVLVRPYPPSALFEALAGPSAPQAPRETVARD